MHDALHRPCRDRHRRRLGPRPRHRAAPGRRGGARRGLRPRRRRGGRDREGPRGRRAHGAVVRLRRQRLRLGRACDGRGDERPRPPAGARQLRGHRQVPALRGGVPRELGADPRGQPHRHVLHVPRGPALHAERWRCDRERRVERRADGAGVLGGVLRVEGRGRQPHPGARLRVPQARGAGQRRRPRWHEHADDQHVGVPGRGRSRRVREHHVTHRVRGARGDRGPRSRSWRPTRGAT